MGWSGTMTLPKSFGEHQFCKARGLVASDWPGWTWCHLTSFLLCRDQRLTLEVYVPTQINIWRCQDLNQPQSAGCFNYLAKMNMTYPDKVLAAVYFGHSYCPLCLLSSYVNMEGNEMSGSDLTHCNKKKPWS